MWALAEEYLPSMASEWSYAPQTVVTMPWVMLVRLSLVCDEIEDARWKAAHS